MDENSIDNRIPEGWHIVYSPKPIPIKSFDWDFWHDNYDGADEGNGLCGCAESVDDAIKQINEIIADAY